MSHGNPRLRREFQLAVVGVGVLVIATTLATAIEAGRAAAAAWFLGTSVFGGFLVVVTGRNLHRNHDPDNPMRSYDRLGLANWLTITRGGCIAVLAGFLLVDPNRWVAWLPAACYLLAISLDWVDGRLARYRDQLTTLGEHLDMAVDTSGLLVASLVGVRWGAIPVWYLSVPLARYIYRGALEIRRRRGHTVDPLPPSSVRRPIAGVQMAFVAGALVPGAPSSLVWIGAVIATGLGLASFGRDYLAVTGRLNSQ